MGSAVLSIISNYLVRWLFPKHFVEGPLKSYLNFQCTWRRSKAFKIFIL